MNIRYKTFNSYNYKNKKIIKRKEAILHNFEDDITKLTIDFCRNEKKEVIALMNLDNKELFMIPPGTNKEDAYLAYKAMCDIEKIKYIEKDPEFNIAVPYDWYIEKAQEFGLLDRLHDAKIEKKRILEAFDKTWNKIMHKESAQPKQ